MSAQAERSYRWLFWTLVIVGFALDQGSKYGIFRALYNDGHGGNYPLLAEAFDITVSYTRERETGEGLLSWLRTRSGEHLPKVNRGALFGLGNENARGEHWNGLFLLVSLGAALAILGWSLRRGSGRDPYLCLSLGLILAGTLGNLYDRVVFDGVRDFLWWYWQVNWPVFNLADCCLVCGASLLLWQALGSPAPAAEHPSAQAAASASPVDYTEAVCGTPRTAAAPAVPSAAERPSRNGAAQAAEAG
jgi:lipoprotein signal peptidase